MDLINQGFFLHFIYQPTTDYRQLKTAKPQ